MDVDDHAPPNDPELFPTAAAGAASGAVAAVVMGAVFVVADRLGLSGEPPPERIARVTTRRMTPARGPSDAAHAEAVDAPLGAALHLAFGAVLGASFALGAPPLERRIRAIVDAPEATLTTAGALAFASAVYLVSYAGWVPALSLLPPPDRDRPGRQLTTALAHLVFGAALAATLERTGFGPRDRSRPGARSRN